MARNKLSAEALEYFRQQGAKGGRKRAENLSPEERKLQASNAAKARAAKRKAANPKS